MGWLFDSMNVDIGERQNEWETCHMAMNLDYDPCEQVGGLGWIKNWLNEWEYLLTNRGKIWDLK